MNTPKRALIFALIALLALTAVSCGRQADDVPPDPEEISYPDESVESAEPAQKCGETDDNDRYNTALSMIGQPLDELIAAIGEPDDSSYASSCIGDGDDGELYYGSFTVCTYREGGEEKVVDVYK